MNYEHLSGKLINHIVKQFDNIKDKYNLTYEEDFESFAVGYTLGIMGTIKTDNKNKIKQSRQCEYF